MSQNGKKLERSIGGLREALFATLEDLRTRKISPEEANAIAHVSSEITKTVSVQLAYEKLRLEHKLRTDLQDMPLIPNLNETKDAG